MSYKSSFSKMLSGAAFTGLASAIIVTQYGVVEPNLWKDIFIVFVAFGVPLAGFLLTVLSIFAAFSGTAYMKRLLKAKKTFGNVIESYLAAVIINLCLAVVSVVGVALIPKVVNSNVMPPPPWTQVTSIALFGAGIYCTIVCVYYLRIILKALMGKPEPPV